MLRGEWKRGEKAELAVRCELRTSYLLDVLAGRRNVSAEMALRIESNAHAMGLALGRLDVLYPMESKNPLLAEYK